MSSINGRYQQFAGKDPITSLQIAPFKGNVFTGSLTTPTGEVPISGIFDEATLQVSFNDASLTGQVLMTTFFTGKVVIAERRIEGISGSWTEQTLGGADSLSGGGKPGAKTHVPPSLTVQYKVGGWFAFNRDPLWIPTV